MNLCFVCNEYPPSPHGGIGIFVNDLCHQLFQRGHQCFVIGFDSEVDRTITRVEDGIIVKRLHSPYARWKGISFGRYNLNPGFFLERMYLSRKLDQWIWQENIHLVESYDWAGPLWHKPPVPLIVRMHGANTASCYTEGKQPGRFIFWIERRNLQLADRLVAVSDYIGETTLKALNITAKDWGTIYNGIDMQKFRPIDHMRNRNQILYVGSLHPRKGIFELFKAFAYITKNNHKAYLKIVGRIPAEPSGSKLKADLLALLPGYAVDRVEFKGYVPHEELPEIYNQAGLAVFPSHAEAFGLTCAEAMACGTPVIMTKKGSGPELVEDGVSGLLVDPLSPDDLFTAIQDLLEDPDLRDQIGSKAVESAYQKFNNKKVTNLNEELYFNLLRND